MASETTYRSVNLSFDLSLELRKLWSWLKQSIYQNVIHVFGMKNTEACSCSGTLV